MTQKQRDSVYRSFVKGMLFTKQYLDEHPEFMAKIEARRDELLEKKIEEKLSEKVKELLPKET